MNFRTIIVTMAQSDDRKQPTDPLPRRNWSQPIAHDTGALSGTAFARAGFRDPTLVLRWDEIAGADVARIARPLKLSEGPAGGVLTLKAEPGASLFLQHETRALCERINAYLGRPVISKLRFVQGPLAVKPVHRPPPKAHAAVPPDDPALTYKGAETLRDALVNLARARRSRRDHGTD